MVEDLEQCDDGNMLSGDGCSNGCQIEIEAGFMCAEDINNDQICDTSGEISVVLCLDSSTTSFDIGCSILLPVCDESDKPICRECMNDAHCSSNEICNISYACEEISVVVDSRRCC